MPKFRATRRKKIKFHGNRHTRRMSATEVEDDATANNTSLPSSQNTQTQDPVTSSQQPEDSLNTQLSISHTKVTPITTAFQKKTSAANVPCGNRILDIGVLGEVFSIFSCPGCNDISTVKLLQKKKEGLSFEFELFCESCEWFHTFWSSKRRKKCHSFDINSSIYYDSVAHFNVGNQASLDIYNGMGIDCGFCCHANNEFRCAAKQSSSIYIENKAKATTW